MNTVAHYRYGFYPYVINNYIFLGKILQSKFYLSSFTIDILTCQVNHLLSQKVWPLKGHGLLESKDVGVLLLLFVIGHLRCNTFLLGLWNMQLVQDGWQIQIKVVATFFVLLNAHMNILFKFWCSLNGHIGSPNYVDD